MSLLAKLETSRLGLESSPSGSYQDHQIEEIRTTLLPKAKTPPKFNPIKVVSLFCFTLLCLVTTGALAYASGYHSAAELSEQGADNTANQVTNIRECKTLRSRKEWRSLSTGEKRDYLRAFQCFIDSPSKLGMNTSLYDDFAWVHNHIADHDSTHGKAPFLPWHRLFIRVYEQELQETCNYNGSLPYWDWSLDWQDLRSSPTFDSNLGFGGDGDPTAPKFGVAHCVTDTPFENLKPVWSGKEYTPHCLTRWFEQPEDWFGEYVAPDALAEVLTLPTYEEFFNALEMKVHDIIPAGIRGDFSAFTAPNDPIFYLHHAQLDRLWWLWQLRDKRRRILDYGGPGHDGNAATLADKMRLLGLQEDRIVADVMNTEAEGLCYQYM